MKKLILLLTAILIIQIGKAQTINAYNPLAQNLHFSTEPNVFGFQNCSETFAKFNFGLTTQVNADSFATQPLKINICLQGFLPANINPSNVVFGPQSQYFQWTYDILSNCLTGVQIDTIFGTGPNIFNLDPRSFGEISVRLQIPPYLPVPVTLSVDVALDVPTYMQVGNSADDHQFVQTQNYIGMTTVAGTLFNDTANSSTPSGLPLGRPGGIPMYVNVIDANTGLVEDNVMIDSNGAYFVDSLQPQKSYNISISTIQGINGQTAPTTALPANWVYTSEDCCDNLSNDGLANGILSAVWASTCPVTNANFAISNSLNLNSNELNQIQVVLALNELNFQIVEKECTTLLFWNNTAAHEYKRYEIMRKEVSNLNFTKIGEVNVLPNTPSGYQYTFVSKNDNQEKKAYHYQLRLIDLNERIFVSPTKTFSLNCIGNNSNATLYPNPAKDNIHLLFDNKNASEAINVTIVDVAGKPLFSAKYDIVEGSNNLTFDISNYSNGYYFLKYTNLDNNEIGTLKFTIN